MNSHKHIIFFLFLWIDVFFRDSPYYVNYTHFFKFIFQNLDVLDFSKKEILGVKSHVISLINLP